MATLTTTTATTGTLGARATSFVEAWRARSAQRRVYRETYRELSRLTGAELADLGLHRSQLKSIAWQAAHDA
ncbi:hypothetical protein ATO8_11684 [Roseivivax marinus]|jgi:uncharacterized protein YjiS (DUF1127 family)|uniref:YjiS-like domain-containing protein n=1 Tax=Roseivivax marinus TaxID=1379903 RepID=W4HIV6_9RHOB|nr:DUF1127 domain-containing protein [Roseivivax marinus]ETW12677.1 hypothetical protein ATO8_11684 [Roseivivax marinus]UMA65733.1 DUF1127 domain-containing protein [Roseivivax marinus]SEL18922.1 protein of unknown function [Roseivivax marinus]